MSDRLPIFPFQFPTCVKKYIHIVFFSFFQVYGYIYHLEIERWKDGFFLNRLWYLIFFPLCTYTKILYIFIKSFVLIFYQTCVFFWKKKISENFFFVLLAFGTFFSFSFKIFFLSFFRLTIFNEIQEEKKLVVEMQICCYLCL